MLKGTRSYDEHLVESLKDPAEVSAYLEAALEDGDPSVLLTALRNVALAGGGVGALAQKTGLNRETLYRTLSDKGNPGVGTFTSILAALGLELSIRPARRMRTRGRMHPRSGRSKKVA